MTEAAVNFAGNLTDHPEVRYTEGGIARAMFRVAVSGRRAQEPAFFTVIVWRDQAEHAAASLAKGSRVVVVGRLAQRSWQADDGTARSVVEVVAEELRPSLTALGDGDHDQDQDQDQEEPGAVASSTATGTATGGHLSRQLRLAYGESPYGYLITRRCCIVATSASPRPASRSAAPRWAPSALASPSWSACRPASIGARRRGRRRGCRRAGEPGDQTDQESRSAVTEPQLT